MPKGPRGEKRPADVIGAAVNFARINSAVKMSPAMAAGIETRLWEMEDIAALIPEMPAGKSGPYKKRAA